MTEVSERRDGICGAHDALAVGICPRCGDNVCSACLDASSALPDHCAACRDRVGAARMPWEEDGGSWARRWGRQTRALLLRPRETLESTRLTSWKAAVGYAATCGALHGAAITAVMSCGFGCLLLLSRPDQIGEIGRGRFPEGAVLAFALLAPLLMTLWQLFVVALRSLCFHLPVALFGGGGGFGVSVAGCSYVSVLHLGGLVLSLAGAIPLLGSFIYLFGWVLLEVWAALLQTTVARTQHGLSPGRAIIAGWAPFLALSTVGVLGCALIVVVVILGGPTR